MRRIQWLSSRKSRYRILTAITELSEDGRQDEHQKDRTKQNRMNSKLRKHTSLQLIR